jgi:hypothetical protein
MVKGAAPLIRRSGVADANTGASLTSNIRTSSGMFYSRGQTQLINKIEERIARWTMLPAGNGEGIQVLRYEVGAAGRLAPWLLCASVVDDGFSCLATGQQPGYLRLRVLLQHYAEHWCLFPPAEGSEVRVTPRLLLFPGERRQRRQPHGHCAHVPV